MDKLIDIGVIISDSEVTELYKIIPNAWVLLEPVEFGENKKAVKVKILKYNEDKEVLRDFVLDQDDWEGLHALIYFYTGNDGNCKI
ncbi:MAG: hypothetical protein OEX22_02160 [Cyclobacteriaceae bacterium]|nr:hypothetical protein [Cyclobacteriaceae bacterium]